MTLALRSFARLPQGPQPCRAATGRTRLHGKANLNCSARARREFPRGPSEGEGSMRKLAFAVFSTIVAIAFLAGCSGSNTMVPPPGQSAMVSFSMTDAPPAGVTVLSFEVSLTGATLNPGNVDLLGGKG